MARSIRWCLTAVALLLAPTAWAQQTAPAPTVETSDPSPALWLVSDADSKIWLFGTVHLLDPSVRWQTQELRDALVAADKVIFEAATDATAQARVQPLVRQKGLNPAGITLTSTLPDATVERLRRVSAALGLTLPQLEPLRPWLAGLTLVQMFIQSTGASSAAGVETVLTAEAKALGKPIGYLESMEQQIGFLADLSEPGQLMFLEQSLRDIEEKPDSLDAIISAWRSGDTDGLEREVIGSVAEVPEIYQALFVRRNRDWVIQIEEMLAGSGTIFIGVGAGHLVGAEGVPTLLRAKGIEAVRQ